MGPSKNLGFNFIVLILSSCLVIVIVAANPNNSTNIINPSKVPPFTNKETAAIKQFREKVSGALYESYMKTDQYLIRWIRDSNFDLEAAKKKLLKAIEWRKTNKIDTILQEDFSSFQKNCPYSIKGHDRNNRPLATASFGRCDLRKLAVSGNIEKFERFIVYTLESCADAVKKLENSGEDVRDAILIADFNGFNLRQHGCLRCVPVILSVFNYYELYYPHYIHRIIFINIPRIAGPIIDLLLPTFSPKTRDIFKAYGYDRSEWERDIRKLIEPNQLTHQFGGNKNSL